MRRLPILAIVFSLAQAPSVAADVIIYCRVDDGPWLTAPLHVSLLRWGAFDGRAVVMRFPEARP